MIDVFATQRLLGRHVVRTAERDAFLRQLAIFEAVRLIDLGDAEVEQLRLLATEFVTCDQDVVGLDVAVNDALVVRRAQPVGQRQQHLHRLNRRQTQLAAQDRAEALALHQLHHQERIGAAGPTEVEHAHHRGMPEPSRGVGFARHARGARGTAEIGVDQLERDVHAQDQ